MGYVYLTAELHQLKGFLSYGVGRGSRGGEGGGRGREGGSEHCFGLLTQLMTTTITVTTPLNLCQISHGFPTQSNDIARLINPH